jgi:CHAT domain
LSVIGLAIGPGGTRGTFRVEVVDSPAGQASTTVELDVDSLLARRGQLEQAVLASGVPSRRVLPETERPLRETGQVLFASLLGAGEVAARYRASAALAAARGEGLRVVLRIDTPALAGLPWEAMFDHGAGVYVCRQDQLVRHVPVASVSVPLPVEGALRILGVVSSPYGLPPLDVQKEKDHLARALGNPVAAGLVELHWAPSATWADLQDQLLDDEWHVLHFVGHGDFDPDRDEGVLALVAEDGRADLIAAHRLVDLLRQARPMPRLVVLNSCSGGVPGVRDLFSGTAAALVRGGVSAVAAMQYEISDSAAVAFARGFYAAVARGRGVDDAVSSGRVGILGLGDRTLEWVTPVLYLCGYDGRLFTLPTPIGHQNLKGTEANESPGREKVTEPAKGGREADAAVANALLDNPEPVPSAAARQWLNQVRPDFSDPRSGGVLTLLRRPQSRLTEQDLVDLCSRGCSEGIDPEELCRTLAESAAVGSGSAALRLLDHIRARLHKAQIAELDLREWLNGFAACIAAGELGEQTAEEFRQMTLQSAFEDFVYRLDTLYIAATRGQPDALPDLSSDEIKRLEWVPKSLDEIFKQARKRSGLPILRREAGPGRGS